MFVNFPYTKFLIFFVIYLIIYKNMHKSLVSFFYVKYTKNNFYTMSSNIILHTT